MKTKRIEPIKTIAYHYCSSDAFYSIISSKSFYLFSLTSSRDPKEHTAAKEVLKKLKSSLSDFNNDTKFSYSEEHYSLSLSYNRDTSNHFNEYADQKRGVCIAIDTEAIERYYEDIHFPDILIGWISFVHILYMPEEQEKFITELIEKAKDMKLYDAITKNNSKIIYEMVKSRFKLQSYQNEHELRLSYYEKEYKMFESLFTDMYQNDKDKIDEYQKYIDSENMDEKSRNKFFSLISNIDNQAILGYNMLKLIKKVRESFGLDDEIRFSHSKGKIRKYKIFNFSILLKYGFIKEIILGSECLNNTKEIKEFCKSHGIKCRVSLSKM